VIAIFTKFDGLVTSTFNELWATLSIKDATKQKFDWAQEKLNTSFIELLMMSFLRPSDYVRLDGMPNTYICVMGDIV
jgi:hypothetical protein